MTSRTRLPASTTDAVRGRPSPPAASGPGRPSPARAAAGWALLGGLALVAGVAPPARAATTELIDVGTDGNPPQGDDLGSYSPTVSANGNIVAFATGQHGIVQGGPVDDAADILVRDRRARTTERVSVASDGTQANDTSGDGPVSMSADGRYVAFDSQATNLVPGDTGFGVYVHDRRTGATVRADLRPDGTPPDISQPGGDRAYDPMLSADGRQLAFASGTPDLVPGDTNGTLDVFVRDLARGVTARVSLTRGGGQANGRSEAKGLSSAGRFVLFDSDATNLVRGDTNGVPDVFVRDRRTGTTERVSVSSAGAQANGASAGAWLSGDGRFAVFESDASNLVAGDTNGVPDVFVRDRRAGTTTRVSLGRAGAQANGASFLGRGRALTPDGRYVTFSSEASNLVAGDTNGTFDVFVRDLARGVTTRVSLTQGGGQADRGSSSPALSADGRVVVFESSARNLVPRDENRLSDVFARVR